MGAILWEAWNLYRKHFVALATIMLVVWVPCEIFSNWMEFKVFGPDDFQHAWQLERFLNAFVGIIALSGIYYYLNEASCQGTASVGQAFGAGFSYWGQMFATRLLVGIGLFFGFLLLILPGVYLMVRWTFCELLVITEGAAAMDAVRRSMELTKGKFWRILGYLVVGSLPVVFVILAIGIVDTEVDALDNWPATAVGDSLMDLASIFLYTLIRAIYMRLIAEEAA